MDIQRSVINYNYASFDNLNWKQRLEHLEPALKNYFKESLIVQLHSNNLEIEISGEEARIFGNNTRSEVINEVTNKWRNQGCPLINLSKWIDEVYDAAEQEVISESMIEA